MRQTRPGFPFSFSCQRSGNCCSRPGGHVQVTDAEIAAIARHLGLTEPAFRSRYVAATGRTLVDAGNLCVFLQDGSTTACSIHPARPEQCRAWPFWPELLDDPDQLREAMRLCPGIEKLE